MKIIVASKNQLKLGAIQRVFAGLAVEVIGVEVASGVPEQPEGDETLHGAKTRATNIKNIWPDADVIIGIESGLYHKANNYYDKAVIYSLVKKEDGYSEHIFYSEEVMFDQASVEEARSRRFGVCTAGMVMKEKGIVGDHRDPHKTLTGKSRTDYIEEAVLPLKDVVFPFLSPPVNYKKWTAVGVAAAALAGIAFFVVRSKLTGEYVCSESKTPSDKVSM